MMINNKSSPFMPYHRPGAPYQYPFRAAIEMSGGLGPMMGPSMLGSTPVRRPPSSVPCNTPVVTPLTAAQLALQMAEEAEAQSAINGRFYKTRMCLFHQKGACVKGDACSYAHCESELRPAPDLVKTRLCQDWLNGNCTSHVCKFAHGRHELRFTHDFYKTKICHFWQQGGCTKGVFCRHAHGSHELRPPATDTSSSDGSEGGPRPRDGPGSRSSTRSSNRSGSPTVGSTTAVFEALRLASEARKLVERGAELLMQSAEAAPLGATPSGHRSQPSCGSPLPAYGSAGSGITVTTTAPSLAFTGHSTPTEYVTSPALSFASEQNDMTLVDQLIESLLKVEEPQALPPSDGGVLAEAINTLLMSGWEDLNPSPACC